MIARENERMASAQQLQEAHNCAVSEAKAAAQAATDAATSCTQQAAMAIDSSQANGEDLPYEKRVKAWIGNLAWDSDSENLMTVAKDLLASSGVDEGSFTALAANVNRQGKGSSCQCVFNENRMLPLFWTFSAQVFVHREEGQSRRTLKR